jgi:prepilin signal peptidase PulO-like enzyme (type II secretory pathway)
MARFLIFLIFSLGIAVIDFRSYRIPNVLLLCPALALILQDLLWEPWEIPVRLLAALGAWGFLYLVRLLCGGLGKGDVKYSALIGYFLGPAGTPGALFFAALLGIVFWTAGRVFLGWGREKRIPFGPWLSLGAIITVLLGIRPPCK